MTIEGYKPSMGEEMDAEGRLSYSEKKLSETREHLYDRLLDPALLKGANLSYDSHIGRTHFSNNIAHIKGTIGDHNIELQNKNGYVEGTVDGEKITQQEVATSLWKKYEDVAQFLQREKEGLANKDKLKGDDKAANLL